MSAKSKVDMAAVWGTVNEERFIGEVPYLQLFEKMSDGVMVYRAVDKGRDFTIVDMNPSAERISKLDRKSATGKLLTEMFPGVEEAGLLDAFRRVSETGESEDVPLVNYKDDNRNLWVENRVLSLGGDLIVATFIDVSERKETEDALKESESRFRMLVENSMEVVYQVGADGTVAYVSPSAQGTMGFLPAEVIGKSFLEFVHPDDTEFLGGEFERGLHGNTDPSEFRMLRKDGSARWVRTTTKPIEKGNPGAGLTGVMADITDRKLLEGELERSNENLKKALTELKEAESSMVQRARLSALGEMASGIAHDFNNVLMPIVGLSDFLIQNPKVFKDQEEALSVVTQINEAADDARNIVQRLRLIHRGDGDQSNFEDLQIDQIVKSAVTLTSPKWKEERAAQGSQIDLEMDLKSGRKSIHGNASELREMMMNLLLNAVDAMSDGGLLSVKTSSISDVATIEVSDTGIGMSEEQKQRCLEAFYTTKGVQGTGLGLSMVNGIVERHNGIVEIDSVEGEGTTIRIILPFSGRSSSKVAAPVPEVGKVTSMKILAVDDDPRSLRLVELLLANDGHEVTGMLDGKEALKLLKREKFDLVVSDRAMPDVRGDAVLKLAKLKNPDGLTIMLTGFGDIMQDEGALPDGVDKVMSKPVTRGDFRTVIGKMVQRRDELAR